MFSKRMNLLSRSRYFKRERKVTKSSKRDSD